MAVNNIGNDAKEKALQQALDQIQKQYGKGAIMKLGDDSLAGNIDVISTFSVLLSNNKSKNDVDNITSQSSFPVFQISLISS